jgi:hypothetical protein
MAKRSGKRLSSRWRGAMVIELKEAPDGAAESLAGGRNYYYAALWP